MKKHLIYLSFLLLAACQNTLSHPIGSTAWQEWVESVIQTSDNQGHGPDVGSDEWCQAVNKKLLNNQMTITPCTNEWNQLVDRSITG